MEIEIQLHRDISLFNMQVQNQKGEELETEKLEVESWEFSWKSLNFGPTYFFLCFFGTVRDEIVTIVNVTVTVKN